MSRKRFNPHDVGGFGLDVDFCPVSMRDEFSGAPPFTVLDARTGDWQTRKRAWVDIGIDSEMGRGKNLLKMSGVSVGVAQDQEFKEAYEAVGRAKKKGAQDLLYKNQARLNALMAQRGLKNKSTKEGTIDKGLTFGTTPNYDGRSHGKMTGTSIFDPVLCELLYQWWCPKGGHVLDPFSGGSVRGIVAAVLDRRYTGIDIRSEQIEANVHQWGLVAQKPWAHDKPTPRWIVGDSLAIRGLAMNPDGYDFLMSCPPYGNLEKYSNDPNDISNMSHEQFIEIYRHIVKRSCSMLKPNRFAAFVVGDFRDKDTGIYRNFTSDTIQAFLDAGMHYYNEAILVTCVGSLPIRAGAHFRKSRKLGKTHQNVFVFWKGDPNKIQETISNEF